MYVWVVDQKLTSEDVPRLADGGSRQWTWTRYFNVNGRLLWIGGPKPTPARQVGDKVSHDRIKLRVIGAVVAGHVQYVGVELDEPAVLAKARPAANRRGTVANDATIPTVRVPRAMLEALLTEAERRGEPLSAVVRRGLLSAIAVQGKPNKNLTSASAMRSATQSSTRSGDGNP